MRLARIGHGSLIRARVGWWVPERMRREPTSWPDTAIASTASCQIVRCMSSRTRGGRARCPRGSTGIQAMERLRSRDRLEWVSAGHREGAPPAVDGCAGQAWAARVPVGQRGTDPRQHGRASDSLALRGVSGPHHCRNACPHRRGQVGPRRDHRRQLGVRHCGCSIGGLPGGGRGSGGQVRRRTGIGLFVAGFVAA